MTDGLGDTLWKTVVVLLVGALVVGVGIGFGLVYVVRHLNLSLLWR